MDTNYIDLLTVGVDVGSSTSHLVFSNLHLERDEESENRRFNIQDRNIIYEGQIINTPLLNPETIDVDALSSFLKEEYTRAGITPEDIQTGAVIITGETAKKQNARQLVAALSNDAGKFVAASAGPNFESVIAAMGSGATSRSALDNKTILSCDVGGGTANCAISINGEITSTSCVAVGGRLIAIDDLGIIRRIGDPAQTVLDHLGVAYQTGDKIRKKDLDRIAETFAQILIEVISGPAHSSLARDLMVTADLDFPPRIDEYMFSGGVAELIYGGNGKHYDIGQVLADKINALICDLPAPVAEPANKIRATVIGAGAYSLSISGISGSVDEHIEFPIKNVPVIRVDVDRDNLSVPHVVSQIQASYKRFDIHEGDEIVALYFKDPVRNSYAELEVFAKGIEAALPISIDKQIPVILVFETDIAGGVGNVIRLETRMKHNLLSIDELILQEGDWIDIGQPLLNNQSFPVTVKSLAFHNNGASAYDAGCELDPNAA